MCFFCSNPNHIIIHFLFPIILSYTPRVYPIKHATSVNHRAQHYKHLYKIYLLWFPMGTLFPE